MKKLVFLSVLLTAMPLGMMAQDDLYFTPKKSDTKSEVRSANPQYDKCPTYYCGSNRDVDEYNRRGRVSSYYQKIGTDSLGNDIIQFHAGNGQYPDSLVLDTIYPGSEQYYAYDGGDSDDSFAYSRRLNRFDNAYGWYDPWFYDDLTWDYPYYGYGPYWRYGWGWGDPWYCGYYGWGGWGDPWYYGYYGWRGPWYGWRGYWGPGYVWGGSIANPQRGRQFGSGSYGGGRLFGSGTRAGGASFDNVGRPGNRSFGNGTRAFGSGNRGFGKTTAGSTRSFGSNATRSYNYDRSFGNNNNTPTRSYSAPMRNSSPSFGGSRSFGGGGGSFGGGRSFGGGSTGGGHSFGGRR